MGQAQKYVVELLKLSPDERSEAAEALLVSLEEDAEESHLQQTWAIEIERRIAEDAPGIPANVVFAEGRTRLKNRS